MNHFTDKDVARTIVKKKVMSNWSYYMDMLKYGNNKRTFSLFLVILYNRIFLDYSEMKHRSKENISQFTNHIV